MDGCIKTVSDVSTVYKTNLPHDSVVKPRKIIYHISCLQDLNPKRENNRRTLCQQKRLNSGLPDGAG